MKAHPIPAREFWYESAGTRLFAVESGQGLPIILLHGGLADHRAIVYRLGALAAEHRLIAPDVRAAGRSIDGRDLGWDRLADDIAALIDHLGLDQAIVGGKSAGSAIALRFALRHPRRCRALLLLAPVYAGDEHGITPAMQAAFARMHEFGSRAPAEGIQAIFPIYEALPPDIRAIALGMARGFDPASVAATTRFLAAGVQPFSRLAELAALTMPTLVIPGDDPEHCASVAHRYAQVLPHATLGDPTRDHAESIDQFARGLRLDSDPDLGDPFYQ